MAYMKASEVVGDYFRTTKPPGRVYRQFVGSGRIVPGFRITPP